MTAPSDTTFFLVAGEKSGDLIASKLIEQLSKQFPSATFEGVAGPKMRRAGVQPVLHQETFEIFGFSEVFRNLNKLRKHFKVVLQHILNTSPTCVILVDYPGFNLRMAKRLRGLGYSGKIVQYVSPTVWAWGKGRIQKMVEVLDLLLTIYPFEDALFSKVSLESVYVGNPIEELVSSHHYRTGWKQQFGIPAHKEVVALFPGSRIQELKSHLPYQLSLANSLHQSDPERVFVLSCAHQSAIPEVEKCVRKTDLVVDRDLFLIPQEFSYELMQEAYLAFAKSGTVTLELALHGCPSLVMYDVKWINRLIAKYLIRLKLRFFCIVNILGQKEIFPEFIEKKLNVPELIRALSSLVAHRERCVDQCRQVSDLLGRNQASTNAALAIKKMLR